MTTVMPDAVTIPQQRVPEPAPLAEPATGPGAEAAADRAARRPWGLVATTGALVLVMAATTVTALVRANERGHRLTVARHDLAAVRREVADVRASLATAQVDLNSARTSLNDVQSALSDSKTENAALMSCVDSLLDFIGAAADGDVAAMRRAATDSVCGDVLDSTVSGTSGSDGSTAA